MIITQPMEVTVNSNGSAVFNVTTMGGLTYQWQRNGSDLMERPGKFEGVNTTELTVLDAQNEDEGSYVCVVTNGAGDSVTSNEAILTIGKNQ